MLKQLLNFSESDRGATAVGFALVALPLLLCIGVAVDYSNLLRLREKVMHATDAAILAAAVSANEKGLISGDHITDTENLGRIIDHLEVEFDNYFLANMQLEKQFDFVEHSLSYDVNSGETLARVSYVYEPYFVGVLGGNRLDVNVQSSVIVESEQAGAISMFLVLDKSYSMKQNGKMNTLKLAVNNLSAQFETSDPSNKYIRLGSIAYDTRLTRLIKLDWGSQTVNRFVQKLISSGGTDSSKAVNKARGQLKNRREVNHHNKKNGQIPQKIMVFMTDGANNTSRADRKTMKTCDRMKIEGIEVFTVAFSAPARGQKLLEYCATSTAHFFNAESSQAMLNAFRKIGEVVSERVSLTR